jgi:hypothetical protein
MSFQNIFAEQLTYSMQTQFILSKIIMSQSKEVK